MTPAPALLTRLRESTSLIERLLAEGPAAAPPGPSLPAGKFRYYDGRTWRVGDAGVCAAGFASRLPVLRSAMPPRTRPATPEEASRQKAAALEWVELWVLALEGTFDMAPSATAGDCLSALERWAAAVVKTAR